MGRGLLRIAPAFLSISYDGNGVTLLINGFYNRQTLHSFDAVNGLITAKGILSLKVAKPSPAFLLLWHICG